MTQPSESPRGSCCCWADIRLPAGRFTYLLKPEPAGPSGTNGRDALLPSDFRWGDAWTRGVHSSLPPSPAIVGAFGEEHRSTARVGLLLGAAGRQARRRPARGTHLLTQQPAPVLQSPQPGQTPQHLSSTRDSARVLPAPGLPQNSPTAWGSLTTPPAAGAGPFCLALPEWGCLPPAGGGQPARPPPSTLGLGKHFQCQQCVPSIDTLGLSSHEEECLKMLFALHTLFPRSAQYSTAVSHCIILKKCKNSGAFKIILEVFH